MSDEKKQAPEPSAERGGRTLVLCFDGTANEFDATNTNIVSLFALLEKEDPRQLVYYQTGVGTYIGPSAATPIGKSFAKWMDICMAWYLDAHVIDGYKFLQNNYKKGDRICLFGFSRGAYTARALAGMLYTIGLLPPDMPEQVEFAYRIFKKGKATAIYKRSFCRTVKIEFIGVFDTVSSVGAMFPRVLPFSVDNHITKTFRHALSLDERRAKFRSNTWHLVHPEIHLDKTGMPVKQKSAAVSWLDKLAIKKGKKSVEAEIEEEEREIAEAEGEQIEVHNTDVKEVWFAGGHCDVGGGNALDKEPYKLANISLRWMLREIIQADTGIIFNLRKLMKFGVPGTEFAPPPVKIRASTTPPVSRSPTANNTFSKGSNKLDMPAPGAERPVNPSVANPHSEIQEQPSPSIASPASPDAKRKTWMTGTDTGETMTSGDSVDGEQMIEVPWWYRDAIEPMRDELLHQPAWWLLELLPFFVKHQDEHSHWKRNLRVNAFRPRMIPKPPHPENPNHHENCHAHGATLPPHTLVHESVRTRMEAPEARERTWRSLYLKKDQPYTPRAWPKHGDPVFVE